MDKGEVGGHEEMVENYTKGFEEGEGDVVISIEKMLTELSPINSECFMYQVPKLHRMMNDIAYTPQLISIGPFHHGQPEFKATEQYKLRALKRYLTRLNLRVEEAMSIGGRWEEKARSCYSEPIDMNNEDFVKMMLLDGCFILEFMNTTICKKRFWGEDEDDWMDDILLCGLMYDLKRDLTMFENQLPFFVLQELFDLSSFRQNIDKVSAIDFMEWMAELFSATTTPYDLPSNVINKTHKVRHLVDLLRFYYTPSLGTEEYEKFNEAQNNKFVKTASITELYEAGVKVKSADDADSLMDFSFKNGVLKIPPFIIHTNFELQIRNLIVSEIFHGGVDQKYIFHYLALLDDLINTEKDVSILVKERIITNNMGGSDEQVSTLINNLRLNAPTFPTNYYYANMCKDLNAYCNKWWHKSMASLRRDYFNTPWAFISFVAATILLLLTLLQTLFSVPSLFHN